MQVIEEANSCIRRLVEGNYHATKMTHGVTTSVHDLDHTDNGDLDDKQAEPKSGSRSDSWIGIHQFNPPLMEKAAKSILRYMGVGDQDVGALAREFVSRVNEMVKSRVSIAARGNELDFDGFLAALLSDDDPRSIGELLPHVTDWMQRIKRRSSETISKEAVTDSSQSDGLGNSLSSVQAALIEQCSDTDPNTAKAPSVSQNPDRNSTNSVPQQPTGGKGDGSSNGSVHFQNKIL